MVYVPSHDRYDQVIQIIQNSVAIYEVMARFCPLSSFFLFPWEITGNCMTLKEEYEEFIFFRGNEFHLFFFSQWLHCLLWKNASVLFPVMMSPRTGFLVELNIGLIESYDWLLVIDPRTTPGKSNYYMQHAPLMEITKCFTVRSMESVKSRIDMSFEDNLNYVFLLTKYWKAFVYAFILNKASQT